MEAPASKYSNQRSPGREHFPLYPKNFIAIRIVQLVLALVILGLAGYGVAFLVFSGDCLTLFTAIATVICCIYLIVAEFGAPAIYNYWAILGLDIFLVIFWLISFALLAAQVAPAFAGYTYCDYYGDCYTSTLTAAEMRYAGCLAAAAGLGGLQFLLFIASLAVHGVMLHRHRKAGLHAMPAGSGVGQTAAAAPVGGEKVQAQAQTQQLYPQQAQQPYVQQGVPPQGFVPQQQQQPGFPVQQAAPPQQMQHGVPQQPYYPQQVPQQVPSPLSSQPTGNSFQQPPVQHQPMPAHPEQGPYETHGYSAQPTQ